MPCCSFYIATLRAHHCSHTTMRLQVFTDWGVGFTHMECTAHTSWPLWVRAYPNDRSFLLAFEMIGSIVCAYPRICVCMYACYFFSKFGCIKLPENFETLKDWWKKKKCIFNESIFRQKQHSKLRHHVWRTGRRDVKVAREVWVLHLRGPWVGENYTHG